MKSKKPTKSSCKRAMKAAEQTLIQLPNVVGMGVVKDQSEGGHLIALYVSELPHNEIESEAIPPQIPVPNSDETVQLKLIEIGEVVAERDAADSRIGEESI